MKTYEIHPAAHLFPLMSDDELAGLMQDITDNGQREPATLWNGKLIDGRNRATACERLGVELDCCELDSDTDPIKWVLSHNLHRRHLTPSQKAMVAVKLKELLEPEAKEKKKRKPKDSVVEILPQQKREPASRDKAAAAVGVSGKLVDAAEKVTKKGTPELQAAVTSGKVSVSKASKIADAPKDEQAALIDKPSPKVEKASPIKQLIADEPNKLVVARFLFDSCSEKQRADVSLAWSEWWKETD